MSRGQSPTKETKRNGATLKAPGSARKYLSQSDVPSYSLEQAIRVPTAIVEHYAGGPITPLQLAEAMMFQPTSGPFRQLCGAAIAYGLTVGGYNAEQISLEPLGKRIAQPVEDEDDLAARREAVLRPRIIREFLRKYDGSPLPRHEIALNVLGEMGVPRDRAEPVYNLILDSAESLGFIRKIKGKQYIDLDGTNRPSERETENPESSANGEPLPPAHADRCREQSKPADVVSQRRDEINRRVFITHGHNREFIEPIKKLLGFGELVPVVSVEKQSVSKPVPEKVMGDMRGCGAAIIHVDGDETLMDKDGNKRVIVNANVLIEIGAAMALFGRRFILLVRDGVQLPSNLQGLYEVRYKSDSLDGDTTIRLLEAINDIKNNPLPARDAPKGE